LGHPVVIVPLLLNYGVFDDKMGFWIVGMVTWWFGRLQSCIVDQKCDQ
jgi:hypothetical protein